MNPNHAAGFSCRPTVRCEGHGKYRLVQDRYNPFYFVTEAGLYVLPPNEMLTDFRSGPHTPILEWMLPRDEFVSSYVIHDWLCYSGIALLPMDAISEGLLYHAIMACIFADSEHERIRSYSRGFHLIRCSRAFADDTLSECLRTERAPAWKRLLIYAAVRIYGEFTAKAYRRKRNEDLVGELLTKN